MVGASSALRSRAGHRGSAQVLVAIIRASVRVGPRHLHQAKAERRPPWRMASGSPDGDGVGGAPHNLRLKLSGRSGHIRQNPFTLPVAAPARSLSALR